MSAVPNLYTLNIRELKLITKIITFVQKENCKIKIYCLFTNFQTRFDWIYNLLRRKKIYQLKKKTIYTIRIYYDWFFSPIFVKFGAKHKMM